MKKFFDFIGQIRLRFGKYLSGQMHAISAETLGWSAIILIHGATIPTLLALLTGLSDRTPSVDIIMLMWGGLIESG